MSVYGSGGGDYGGSLPAGTAYAPAPMPPKVRFDVIGEAWNLLTRQFGVWFVAGLAFVIPIFIVVGIFYALMFAQIMAMAATGRGGEPNGAEMLAFQARIYGVALPMGLVVYAFQGLVGGGMVRMALRQLRGETIAAGDVFKIGDVAGQLILVGLLQGIAVQLGTMFCYIPGFILGGLFMLAIPLVAERRLPAIEALKESARTLKPDLVMAALFFFVIMLVYSLGGIACGIGMAVTFPLLPISLAIIYRDFFLGGPTPPQYPGVTPVGPANPWVSGQPGGAYPPPPADR
ncbi:MAG: hypothetical protein V4671_12740 [Armatimonadota bacterium]